MVSKPPEKANKKRTTQKKQQVEVEEPQRPMMNKQKARKAQGSKSVREHEDERQEYRRTEKKKYPKNQR